MSFTEAGESPTCQSHNLCVCWSLPCEGAPSDPPHHQDTDVYLPAGDANTTLVLFPSILFKWKKKKNTPLLQETLISMLSSQQHISLLGSLPTGIFCLLSYNNQTSKLFKKQVATFLLSITQKSPGLVMSVHHCGEVGLNLTDSHLHSYLAISRSKSVKNSIFCDWAFPQLHSTASCCSTAEFSNY